MSDMTNLTTDTDNFENNSLDYQGLDDAMIQEVLVEKRFNQLTRKKKIVGVSILVAVLALAGLGLNKWLGTDTTGEYLTALVTTSTITDTIEATGTLEPVRKSEMGFKNDGTIVALHVQPGSEVVAGQILAQQDSNTLKTSREQATITLTQTEISLETATMNYETSLSELSQQEQLFEAGVTSQSELDTARNNLRKSELEFSSTQAKLASDRAKVEQAQADLAEATLVAPFDGIIGAVNGQVGQINGMNISSSTLLTVMSRELQLSALVNEADIGRIEIGQHVEFTSPAFANKVFTGQVLRITPEAQTVSNVQFYPVLISCNDPDNMLYAGMTVSADIIVQRAEDVLSIPMMAVSYAQTYIKQNPAALNNQGNASSNPAKTTALATPGNDQIDLGPSGNIRPLPQETGANTPPTDRSQSARTQAAKDASPSVAQDPSVQETSAKEVETSQGMVVVLENDQPIVKPVQLGMSNGSIYQVIEGLNEGDQVIVGSTVINSISGSNAPSTDSNRSQQNQRGVMGSGMGGPPQGF